MVLLPQAAGGGLGPRNTRLYHPSNWGQAPPAGPPPLQRYRELQQQPLYSQAPPLHRDDDRVVTLGEMSSLGRDIMFEARALVAAHASDAVAEDIAQRLSDTVLDVRDRGRARLERERT